MTPIQLSPEQIQEALLKRARRLLRRRVNNKRRNTTFYIPGSMPADAGVTDREGKTYIVQASGALVRKSPRRHE